MDVIKELTFLLEKNKLKQIDVLGNEGSNTRFTEFYNLVKSDKVQTDEEAALHFYESSPDDQNYKKLKTEFKSRLINTLFFIDVKQPTFNDFQRAYYACWKNWAAVKILMGRMALKSAHELAKHTFEHALRYEFTDLVVESSRFLRHHGATSIGNQDEFLYYKNIHAKWCEVQQAERIVEELFDEVRIHFVKVLGVGNDIARMAAEKFEMAKPYLEKHNSYYLRVTGGLLELYSHFLSHNQTAAAAACERMLEYLDKKSFDVKSAKSIFLNQYTLASMSLRHYDTAATAIAKSISLQEPGNPNWFRCMELYIQVSFCQREYQRASDLYEQTLSDKNFQFLYSQRQEEWRIIEAYLAFLAVIEKVQLRKDPIKKRFKLSKFVNDVPVASQDKRGMNVSILILQIIHLIAERSFAEVVDRIEAMEKYCNRYLKTAEMHRSNCFVRLLIELAKAGFAKAESIERAQKYLLQLEQSSLNPFIQAHEIEMVPYEHLWEYILEILPNKPYYA